MENLIKYQCFYNNYKTAKSDVVIILGDAGINFWLSNTDKQPSKEIKEYVEHKLNKNS